MAESIYNLIPQPIPVPAAMQRHISKHPGDKEPTFSTFGLTGTSKPGYKNIEGEEYGTVGGHHGYRKPHATMGKEGNARHPADILRKGTGSGAGAGDATRMPESTGVHAVRLYCHVHRCRGPSLLRIGPTACA